MPDLVLDELLLKIKDNGIDMDSAVPVVYKLLARLKLNRII
jgi:hypothetical protein